MVGADYRGRTWPWWLGFGCVSGVALWLTWLAYHERLPDVLRPIDKGVHFTIAGLLAFFLDGAARRRSFVVGPVALSTSSLGLAAIIGAEELAQRWSPHRTSSFSDYAADVLGIVIFTWLSRRASQTRLTKPAHDPPE